MRSDAYEHSNRRGFRDKRSNRQPQAPRQQPTQPASPEKSDDGRESVQGVVERIIFTNDEGTFIIAKLQNGISILGNCEKGSILKGVPYKFVGEWQENERFGEQFKFSSWREDVPLSRHGVVEYLSRYAPNIGSRRAHQLCDQFGPDKAINVLKNAPDEAADKVVGLTKPRAREAAFALKAIEHQQEVRVELLDLFAGRGFPANDLIVECLKHFDISAPARIRKDPFVMLQRRMPGCGFARVDTLYVDLGLPPNRLKRVMFAVLYAMRQERGGSTWHDFGRVVQVVGEMVSEAARIRRSIELGLKTGWLAEHFDDDGNRWLAEGRSARDELEISQRLQELCGCQVQAQADQSTSPDSKESPIISATDFDALLADL